MGSLIIYLFRAFFLRIYDFIRHWYVSSFYIIADIVFSILAKIDKDLALVITFKNWTKPLYGDRTIIGYLFGFIFRTFRILVALVVYSLVFILGAIFYLAWSAIPLVLLYQIYKNYEKPRSIL